MNKIKSHLTGVIKFSLLMLVLVVGMVTVMTVQAEWSAPDDSAPAQPNIHPPLNTSDSFQSKDGSLLLRSDLGVSGKVGLGIIDPESWLSVGTDKTNALGMPGLTVGPTTDIAGDSGPNNVNNMGRIEVYSGLDKSGGFVATDNEVGVWAAGDQDPFFGINYEGGARLGGSYNLQTNAVGMPGLIVGPTTDFAGSSGPNDVNNMGRIEIYSADDTSGGLVASANEFGIWTAGAQDAFLGISYGEESLRVGGNYGASTAAQLNVFDQEGNGGDVAAGQYCDIQGENCWDPADGALGGGLWGQSGDNLYPSQTSWNVGIGTDEPRTRLHVQDNLEGDIFRTRLQNRAADGATTLQIRAGDGEDANLLDLGVNAPNREGALNNYGWLVSNDGGLAFLTDGGGMENIRMKIDQHGAMTVTQPEVEIDGDIDYNFTGGDRVDAEDVQFAINCLLGINFESCQEVASSHDVPNWGSHIVQGIINHILYEGGEEDPPEEDLSYAPSILAHGDIVSTGDICVYEETERVCLSGGVSGDEDFEMRGGYAYDVTGDGRVNQDDIDLVTSCVLGDDCTEEEMLRADVNRDGEVDAYDIQSVINARDRQNGWIYAEFECASDNSCEISSTDSNVDEPPDVDFDYAKDSEGHNIGLIMQCPSGYRAKDGGVIAQMPYTNSIRRVVANKSINNGNDWHVAVGGRESGKNAVLAALIDEASFYCYKQ